MILVINEVTFNPQTSTLIIGIFITIFTFQLLVISIKILTLSIKMNNFMILLIIQNNNLICWLYDKVRI